jgi:hypothetical protein
MNYKVGDRVVSNNPLYVNIKGKIFKIEEEVCLIFWIRNIYYVMWEDGTTSAEFSHAISKVQ